jgi:hypothetical protein
MIKIPNYMHSQIFKNRNMNLSLQLNQFDEDYLFFCEPIKNNIMTDGKFIRILYSSDLFTLNGIYLLLKINNIYIERYYNKYKYIFDIHSHAEIIEQVKKIENDILNKIDNNKKPQHKIYEQLCNGNVKIISDKIEKCNNLLLKISGIWETETEYGITYKFMNAT